MLKSSITRQCVIRLDVARKLFLLIRETAYIFTSHKRLFALRKHAYQMERVKKENSLISIAINMLYKFENEK